MGFAVSQGSPLSTLPQGPVGVAEPMPFWDSLTGAVGPNFHAAADTTQPAIDGALLAARWDLHRQYQQALGRKLDPSAYMLQQEGQADYLATQGGVGPNAGVLSAPSDADYRAELAKLRAENPALAALPTPDQAEAQVRQRLAGERERAAQTAGQGVGGRVGAFVGASGAVVADPRNLPLFLYGGPEAGLARTIIGQALLNAGVEAFKAPGDVRAKAAVGIEETPGNVALNVLEAGAGAGAMTAAGHGLGAAFRAALGRGAAAEPLLRGALNLADTEARDRLAVGDLPGPDFDRAAQSLATHQPPPRLEPDRDLADLFSPEAGGGPDVALYKGRPIYAQSFDPANLATDPATFQYKAGVDAAGVTARLKGVDAWDPLAAGRLMIWEDRAGQQFVADGHQRFGLVQRLNDDRGFEHQLDGYLFREADGWSAEDVRVTAALKNIREGSGAPMDAAKVFRDAPEAMRDRSLPVTGDFMAQARGLAALDDDAFKAAVNRVIDERYAAEIGLNAPGRPDLHSDMVRLMKAAEPANVDEARALVVEALQDDWIRSQPDQADLFGYDPSQSAMIGRAKVAAQVKRQLGRDARLYGQLVKHADAIEAGGNALARDANEARLAVDRAALEVTAKLALRHGPIGEAMQRAAKAVTEGETPAKAAAPVLKAVRAALEAGERLDDARAHALAPEPPTAAAEAALERFDDPRGEGAKAQAQAAPEDLETPGILSAGIEDHEDLFSRAHAALADCVPGEAAE